MSNLQDLRSAVSDEPKSLAELDFSNEPVFVNENAPVRVDVPGLPIWFMVKPSAEFSVAAGRARFSKQRQAFVSDRGKMKPANEVEIEYDLMGLFLYKCENLIVDFEIKDPRKADKTLKYNGNPAHTRRCFAEIKSERVCNWINEQIDKIVGWDQEAEDDQRQFPGAAA